jgi:hypothetical protein
MLCFGGTASAAVIAWGMPTNVSGTGDVSTLGTVIEAVNPGANSSGFGASVVVNGVTFDAWLPVGTTTTSTGGHFTLTSAAGHLIQSYDGFGSPGAAPFSTLPASYQTLLGYGDYSQNQSNANDFTGGMTLTLSGLTVGNAYQFQWWANDSRPFATGPITATTGATGVSLDVNTTDAAGGTGQFAVGTFVADAVTQTITFSTTGNGNVQNGFQLRAVPEPGSGGLILAATVGACIRRRRYAAP